MAAYDPDIDRAVLLYNQITGPIFLLTAIGVFLLIWFDKDKRNVVYRRMILCLQLFSIGADQVLSFSATVVLTREWVIYSAGFSFGLGIIIYLLCISQVYVCWFASLLYCHQQVLHPSSKFRLHSHLLKYPIIVMELSAFAIGALAVYSLTCMLLSDDQIPEELSWVRNRPTYGVFRYHESALYFMIVGAIATPPFMLVCFVLFLQIFYNLRVSMRHTSEATRKYQKRAAVTVLLLAVIPGIFITIPFYGSVALAIKQALPFGEYFAFVEVFEQPAASAALFALANTHSIANSLTIVGRSEKYKKIIAVPFVLILPCFRRKRQSIVHAWGSRTT